MSTEFSPTDHLWGDQPLQTPAEAAAFLTQYHSHNDIWRFGITALDGNIRLVSTSSNNSKIRAPSSKRVGAKWFLNKELVGISGDFVTARGAKAMEVEVTGDNRAKAVDVIMKQAGLYAPESYADPAKVVADKHSGSSSGKTMYSRSSNSAPEKAMKQWRRKLELMNNSSSSEFVASTQAPLVLRELGLIGEISLSKLKIHTIFKKYKEIPLKVLVNLPLLLADPKVVNASQNPQLFAA